MDKAKLINKRRGRCMARVLEAFEDEIQPHIPPGAAEQFKALLRRKINGLTIDCVEIMELKPNEAMNGHAQALKDALDPDSTVRAVGRS